jgi:hypothetical protein
MAAFGQEAELNRACPSVLICSQFGQKLRNETDYDPDFAIS